MNYIRIGVIEYGYTAGPGDVQIHTRQKFNGMKTFIEFVILTLSCTQEWYLVLNGGNPYHPSAPTKPDKSKGAR